MHLFVPSAKVTHLVFVLDFAHAGWTVSSAAPAATRLPQSHVLDFFCENSHYREKGRCDF